MHNCKGMGAKIPKERVRLHQTLKGWAGDIPRECSGEPRDTQMEKGLDIQPGECSGEPRDRGRRGWRYNLGSAVAVSYTHLTLPTRSTV